MKKGRKPASSRARFFCKRLEHRGFIIRQPPRHVDVIGVVVAGDPGGYGDGLQQGHGLPDDPVGAEHLEAPGLDIFQQRGVDLGDQGPEAHHVRRHLIDGPGGLPGMTCRPLLAPEPQDDVAIELHSRLAHQTAGRHLYRLSRLS